MISEQTMQIVWIAFLAYVAVFLAIGVGIALSEEIRKWKTR